MSISSLAFLAVRALHVLLAAAWLGTTAFIYLFLSPALEELGPASATLMAAMGRRGIDALMASVGGLTVLTGIWLYWRFTGGFDPAASAGILSLIVGGAVVGRTARKMTALAAKAGATTDVAQRTAIAAEIVPLKRRLSVWGKTVLALQVVALVCMAIGHYV